MKTSVLALLSVLLTASFAGCLAGEEGKEHDHAEHTEGTDHSMHNETAAPGSVADQPPVIVVKILVNGTEVALANDSYAVPSAENVTFDASGSSDPEGQNLTFMWDFGDNGTSEDAVAEHAFAAAGNFTVTLMVHAGEGMSNASYGIVAASSGPAPGTVLRVESKKFTGTTTAVDEATCANSGTGLDRKEFKWTITAAEPDGTATYVSKFTMKITQGTGNIDTDFYLFGPDKKEVGSSHGFEPTDGNEKGFTVEGVFAAGDYNVRVQSCSSINASFTIDMTATYVAA